MPTPAQIFDDARMEYDAANKELDSLAAALESAIADGSPFSDEVVGLSLRLLDGLHSYRDAIHLEGLSGPDMGVGTDVYAAGMGINGRHIPYGDKIQRQISRRDRARRNMREVLARLTPAEVVDRAHLMP